MRRACPNDQRRAKHPTLRTPEQMPAFASSLSGPSWRMFPTTPTTVRLPASRTIFPIASSPSKYRCCRRLIENHDRFTVLAIVSCKEPTLRQRYS